MSQQQMDNVTIVRRLGEAFSAGDMAVVFEILDPDLTWHSIGGHPFAGEYTSRDDFMQRQIGPVMQLSDMTYRITQKDVWAAGNDFVVAHAQSEASRPDGRRLSENDVVMVFRLIDGRVVEVTDVSGPDAGFWS